VRRGRWKIRRADNGSEAKQEAAQDGKGEPMADGEPNLVVEDPGSNSKKEDT
jgi:hypothetical protein